MADGHGAVESRGYQTIIIVITFTAVSLISVFLRGLTRFVLLKSHGPDDIMILIAMAMSIATTVCQCEQVRYGSGKHREDVTQYEGMMSLKYLFFSIIFYNTGLSTTKWAILILYRRIFVYDKMRTVSMILIVFVGFYFLSTVISAIFMCVPVKAFWHVEMQPTSKCVDQYALYYANAGLNIGTDFSILILPLPFIMKLHVSTRQKITVIILLSLGFFTCIVSVLRLHALYVLQTSDDPTWEQPATAYWSGIELNMGITCACLATIRPLITRVAPRLLSSNHSAPPSGFTDRPSIRYPRHKERMPTDDSFAMLHLGRDNNSQETHISADDRDTAVIYPKEAHGSGGWPER